MTATDPAHPIDQARRAQALNLIRALSMVAGDDRQVTNLLAAYAREHGIGYTADTCLAALVVTYGTCMTQPVPLNIPNTEGDQP